MKIERYDTEKYDFLKLISEIYDTNLCNLDSSDKKESLALGEDTHTPFHKKFYSRVDAGWPEFEKLYQSFIEEVIFPMFEDDVLLYQTLPNIRVQRPEAKAVYLWHCDGDDDHRHPPGEINIFLPLTKCEESNTMWVESIPGLGDFQPLVMEYGQFFIGYLNRCRHGNKVNTTSNTRVSFDFRVVPGHAHDESFPERTATTNLEFKVGQYYRKMERESTPKTINQTENKSTALRRQHEKRK